MLVRVASLLIACCNIKTQKRQSSKIVVHKKDLDNNIQLHEQSIKPKQLILQPIHDPSDFSVVINKLDVGERVLMTHIHMFSSRVVNNN